MLTHPAKVLSHPLGLVKLTARNPILYTSHYSWFGWTVVREEREGEQ
jgi:hypothetical protein